MEILLFVFNTITHSTMPVTAAADDDRCRSCHYYPFYDLLPGTPTFKLQSQTSFVTSISFYMLSAFVTLINEFSK
jgi:hypothetical protein